MEASSSGESDFNCAVDISEVPESATLKSLLSVVIEGKVWSSCIEKQLLGNSLSGHSTSAQIIFFDCKAANDFVRRGSNAVGIVLLGKRLHIHRSINLICSRPRYNDSLSRVLLVTGPHVKIDRIPIEAIMAKKDALHYLKIRDLGIPSNHHPRSTKTVVVEFGGVEKGSFWAYDRINKYLIDKGIKGVDLSFGTDPEDCRDD